jgi:hypothetical protein
MNFLDGSVCYVEVENIKYRITIQIGKDENKIVYQINLNVCTKNTFTNAANELF